jgi:hypothetical protein
VKKKDLRGGVDVNPLACVVGDGDDNEDEDDDKMRSTSFDGDGVKKWKNNEGHGLVLWYGTLAQIAKQSIEFVHLWCVLCECQGAV